MWKLIFITLIAFSASVNAEIKVLAFAGSARADSINKKLITEAATIAREMHANVTVVDLKNYSIPFYDEDFEKQEGMPIKAKELRQLMMQSNVILISSPEYNGSLSALLKNTIDWASRTEDGVGSREAFKDKKFVIMSTSPGSGGGARGLLHLRTIIENLGGIVIAEQIVVPDGFNAFNEQGHLKNEAVKKEIEQALKSALTPNNVSSKP